MDEPIEEERNRPVIDKIDQADGYLIIHGRCFEEGDVVHVNGDPQQTDFLSTIRLTIKEPPAGLYDITVEDDAIFSVVFGVLVH